MESAGRDMTPIEQLRARLAERYHIERELLEVRVANSSACGNRNDQSTLLTSLTAIPELITRFPES